MDDLLDGFLKTLRLKVAATTYERKRSQIKSFLRYLAGKNKEHSTVTKQDIEEYLLTLHCIRQARQAMCCLIREFYDYMKIPENPAGRIVFAPERRFRLYRIPNQNDIGRIFERLSSNTSALGLRNLLMVELAYGSGLRRSELVRLDIDDVNFENKTLRVLGKGDKERIVPLTEKAIDAMRQYLMGRQRTRGPLIASFTGRRLPPVEVNRIFREAIGIRPHALRHACATHMLQAGCSIRVLQELLGHNRLTTTHVYTHINKDDLRMKMAVAHPRAGIVSVREN